MKTLFSCFIIAFSLFIVGCTKENHIIEVLQPQPPKRSAFFILGCTYQDLYTPSGKAAIIDNIDDDVDCYFTVYSKHIDTMYLMRYNTKRDTLELINSFYRIGAINDGGYLYNHKIYILDGLDKIFVYDLKTRSYDTLSIPKMHIFAGVIDSVNLCLLRNEVEEDTLFEVFRINVVNNEIDSLGVIKGMKNWAYAEIILSGDKLYAIGAKKVMGPDIIFSFDLNTGRTQELGQALAYLAGVDSRKNLIFIDGSLNVYSLHEDRNLIKITTLENMFLFFRSMSVVGDTLFVLGEDLNNNIFKLLAIDLSLH